MRHSVTIVVMLLALVGCSKKEEFGAVAPAMSANEASRPSNKYMAYEHSVRVDTQEKRITAVYEAVLMACHKAVADQCVVLESNLNTGRDVSAQLKFRSSPRSIQKLIAVLNTEGEIINQSTTAEDLSSPILDSAKKIAMLNDYRSRLEALRVRAGEDVDALIKVNKELALVQSEIEAMSGEQAHLVQRVETQILNVSINAVHSRLFWKPISVALRDFSSNLSEGLSKAITGVAFLIPWSLVLATFVWIGRKLWFRARRAKNNA